MKVRVVAALLFLFGLAGPVTAQIEEIKIGVNGMT